MWRDPAPNGGPPNNWTSEFGGSAWEFDNTTGQYYYHTFLVQQPDLNYRNPEVVEAILDVIRFWLNRGVDGFRVDALPYLFEDEQFRDEPYNPNFKPGIDPPNQELIHIYTKNVAPIHDVVKQFRKVLDTHNSPKSPRVMICEV